MTAARSESWTDRTGNKPTVLYDNGNGTRLKLWTNAGRDGEFESASLESGYYNPDQQWVEQKSSSTATSSFAQRGRYG